MRQVIIINNMLSEENHRRLSYRHLVKICLLLDRCVIQTNYKTCHNTKLSYVKNGDNNNYFRKLLWELEYCLALSRHIVNCSFIFHLDKKSHSLWTVPQKLFGYSQTFMSGLWNLKRVAREGLVPFVALLLESREWDFIECPSKKGS